MIYLCRGSLPWQGLKELTQFQKDTIIFAKKLTTVAHLCRGLPLEFAKYMEYCRSLAFDATPDYAYLRNLLRTVFMREGFHDDKIFDWTAQATSNPPVVSEFCDSYSGIESHRSS